MNARTKFSMAIVTLALAGFVGATFAADQAAPADQPAKVQKKKKQKGAAQAGGAATAQKPGTDSMKHEATGGAVKSEGASGANEPGRDSDTHKPAQGGDVKSGSPAEVPGRSNMGR